jgi:hypothetical protein
LVGPVEHALLIVDEVFPRAGCKRALHIHGTPDELDTILLLCRPGRQLELIG